MRLVLIAAAATFALSGIAASADPIGLSLEASRFAVPAEAPEMDWSGFYAGILGAAGRSPSAETLFGLGAGIGVGAQIDFVLVGAEVSLLALSSAGVETTYGTVLGRGGLVLTDDLLLYAAAGYGWDLQGPGATPLAGAGLEIAVTDSIALRAQYLRSFDGDATIPADQVTLGAVYHF